MTIIEWRTKTNLTHTHTRQLIIRQSTSSLAQKQLLCTNFINEWGMHAFLFRVWFVCCWFFSLLLLLLRLSSTSSFHLFSHSVIHSFVRSFVIFLLATYKDMACTFDDSFIFKFDSPISQVGLKKLINHLHFLQFFIHIHTLIVCVFMCLCGRACVYFMCFSPLSLHLSHQYFGEQQPANINCFSFYTYVRCTRFIICSMALPLIIAVHFVCHFIVRFSIAFDSSNASHKIKVTEDSNNSSNYSNKKR